MFEGLDECQKILDNIIERTGGDWELMNATDRIMTIKIMKMYKQQIDKYMAQEYYKIKMWSSLSVDDVIMSETEPDLTMFSEEFNKLMNY